MPGDWMSVSTTPTRRPSAASRAATLAVVLDLPVPPRKEWMDMILVMLFSPVLKFFPTSEWGRVFRPQAWSVSVGCDGEN